MDTFEAIYSRRSVKHFDPDHAMADAEVTKLIEAAMQAPTSFNIQHWRFVVVEDPDLRKQIRAVGNDQAQMTDASVLIPNRIVRYPCEREKTARPNAAARRTSPISKRRCRLASGIA